MRKKRILLIISGGIAAYKAPELVRLFNDQSIDVRCILTDSGAAFVSPMTLEAISGDRVFQNLFSLTDEHEMGHIKLPRSADLLLVVPASANILAKMARGLADDLATTVLLASDKPVFVAPAMNKNMWQHPATQENVKILDDRGVGIIGPAEGDMVCGDYGVGRMADLNTIVSVVLKHFGIIDKKPLGGKRILVTSGPTRERIDPVRCITNYSSGKQGHAIASAFSRLGAETLLVTGPTSEADPADVKTVHIESALEMLETCKASLPVDVAVLCAAVTDWHIENPTDQKIKKEVNAAPKLKLVKTPDILKIICSSGKLRPTLVIGFAAETENILGNAKNKLREKNCDWIVANDISSKSNTFASESNQVHIVTRENVEDWPKMSKLQVAERLVDYIAKKLTDD